jgi:hypothetical protein
MCRAFPSLLLLSLVAACAPSGPKATEDAALIAQDPVIARALHDPLMSDPDLASRNEANAAIGFVDSSALPVLTASSEEAQAARDALRIEMLETGTLPDLPPASAKPGAAALGPMSGAAELLDAVDAPAACAQGLKEDFAIAANLPAAAAIPRPAMVVQAGGSDGEGCRIRIIRYQTAAPIADVLQYHFVRASRAGLSPQRFAAPADSIAAKGKQGERLAVHLRRTPHRLTGVTLIYRAPQP